jgi:hypothetical protein
MPDHLTAAAASTMTVAELEGHEAVIESSREHFVAVGNALAAIREAKAYRLTGYDTFEDYCEQRWGFGRSAGYKYISASRAAQNVDSLSTKPVGHETARVLSRLPTEGQRQVAARIDVGTATVVEVREAVAAHLGASAPAPASGRTTVDTSTLPTARFIRQSAFAVRATWSRACGAMSQLVRTVPPAELLLHLSAAERAEMSRLVAEWRAWADAFRDQAK